MENNRTVCARSTGGKWIAGFAAAVSASVLLWFLWNKSSIPEAKKHVVKTDDSGIEAVAQIDNREPEKLSPPYQPIAAPANRSGEVPPAFRGAVHPVLNGKTRLAMAAHWTHVSGPGRDHLEKVIPPTVYAMFTDLKPAADSSIYTERDFSRLLPESVESVGQLWEIDSDAVVPFLRQFHPQPAMHLIALGRRAGPDGAFGILRAVSPTHLDILFRIHAEFDVALNVWYTPACFWGRMIVNKENGTVESFRLWLPTDQPLNVHLTVAASIPQGTVQQPAIFRKIESGDRVGTRRDIVHVDQMELVSENPELASQLDWPDSIEMDRAKRELTKSFYAFANINWVPWESALSAARQQDKPILAIVLWGALDDQSC
jgi:hypothetical protein